MWPIGQAIGHGGMGKAILSAMSDSAGNTGGLQIGGVGRSRWANWAGYLGVSWTWCIGMFLPALLWRDLGACSFLVFAIPNVVGAAAMGWLIRSPEVSRAFVARHRLACWCFSAVTVGFQAFFAAWVARVMGGGWWHAGWVACVVAAVLGGVGKRWAGVVAGAVWLVSMVVIGVTVFREGVSGIVPQHLMWPGELPTEHLVPLALVCSLGFGLCPYLDLTFHRARMETESQSRKAFGIGFGVVFAMMIVGTFLTAPVLVWMVGGGSGVDVRLRPMLVVLLSLHTLPQLVYTCWVHGGETERGQERLVLGLCGLAAGVAMATVGGELATQKYASLWFGEVVYRGFMGFYGLAFPAYVLIVAWPLGKNASAVVTPTLGRGAVWLLVCGGAVWFYWLGFVERQTWWVSVGVAVVLAGAALARFVGRPRGGDATAGGA